MKKNLISRRTFLKVVGSTAAVAALAGCGSAASTSAASASTAASGTTSSTATAKEEYDLEFMIPGAKDSDSMSNDIGKALYDKFGVKIKVIGYAGNWEENCATMLAGGNYPELLLLQGNEMVSKYAKAGALQDLGALADQYAPNFLAFYEDALPYWKMATDDHTLYKYTANTPDMESKTSPKFDMMIRSDILEQQGWPEVLDEDSYINLLKTGLQQNPQTDGNDTLGCVMGASEDWVIGDAMLELYAHGKYPERSGIVSWDDEAQKFVDQVLDISAFKGTVKFWNRMYTAGILDPECFTDTDAVAQEKLNTGRSLSTFYVTWEKDDINAKLRQLGKDNMEYVVMPIMLREQIDAGQKRVSPVTDSYDYQSVVITKNCKNPERILEILDWASTDEGQNLLGWGIEGKHYTVDSNGLKVPTQDYIDCATGKSTDATFNDGINSNASYYFLGLSSGLDKNGQCYNLQHDESVLNAQMDDRLKEVYSHYGWDTVTAPWNKNKNFECTDVHTGLYGTVVLDTSSDAYNAETKLKEFKRKQIASLIMSKDDTEFESNWNSFVETYKTMSPDVILKAYNDGFSGAKAEYDSVK